MKKIQLISAKEAKEKSLATPDVNQEILDAIELSIEAGNLHCWIPRPKDDNHTIIDELKTLGYTIIDHNPVSSYIIISWE